MCGIPSSSKSGESKGGERTPKKSLCGKCGCRHTFCLRCGERSFDSQRERWRELRQCAEGCLPAPAHPRPSIWNEPPASTQVFPVLLPVAVFSAQLGFPSRWLRPQPNLFISSSKTLGGRAPRGSGSPSRGLLALHWLFLRGRLPNVTCPAQAKLLPQALGHQSGLNELGRCCLCIISLPLDTGSAEGEGKGGEPVSLATGVGLPQPLLRTVLPS